MYNNPHLPGAGHFAMKITLKRLFSSKLAVILIGLFPILSLWKNNLGQIQSSAVIKPLLFTFLLILVIYSLFLLVSRSPEKSALFSLVILVFIFSFGHVYNLLEQKPLGINIGYIRLFAVYLVIFAGLIFLVSRIKRIPKNVILFLNIVGAVLILFNLFPIVRYEIGIRQAQENAQDTSTVTPDQQVVDNKYPDIYFIILDSYARADILKDVIGYDNSAFLQSLRERGFYIPECAYSNYPTTEHVVESVLNYEYPASLKIYSNNKGAVSPEYTRMVTQSKARAYFKQFGYQFVTGRAFSSSLDIQNSDVYLNYLEAQGKKDILDQNTFLYLYLNTTVYRILSELYQNDPEQFAKLSNIIPVKTNADLEEASFWYNQNNFVFDSMEQIAKKDGHYLVYAHIYSPHYPYVYTPIGDFRYVEPQNEQEEKRLYADAVTYLNQRILELVDNLLKSEVQPVIIIQGDHSIHGLTKQLNKHKILSAYYLPGKLITEPYATITPVNNFRLIIRNYFDPSMELLPDTLYVKWADSDQPVASSCGVIEKP
jgi:hypothetical protein